jgi:hypothetical protein
MSHSIVPVSKMGVPVSTLIVPVSQEEFDDTKGVIRIRKSQDRQHNGQMKKDKQRSTTYCTEKCRTTRNTPNIGVEIRSS